MLRHRVQLLVTMLGVVIVMVPLVSGDDETEVKPAVTDAQRAALEADPSVKKANIVFETETKAAENTYQTAKRKASEKRLGAYRDQLKVFTKSGDFDKAVACKAMITSLETDVRPRPKDVAKFQGHSYAWIKEPATWNIAKRKCEEMGGHLVVMDNDAETEFILKTVEGGRDEVWIGASDEEVEGQWKWISGQILSREFLARCGIDNHQDLQHAAVVGASRNIEDACAAGRRQYICEWEN